VAGTDGIHWELIKYGGNKLLNRIYVLVKQIFDKERIPEEWRETIFPTYKKEDRARCEIYKGTALGKCILQILENVIF